VDVTTRGGIRRGGGGAEPSVVVEAIGDWFRVFVVARLGIVGATARQPDPDAPQLADPTLADQVAGAAGVGGRALLAARLEHDAVPGDGRAHGAPLGDGQGERLLAVDVLLRLARLNHGDGVPVVRRADLDRVDVLAPEHLAKVHEGVAAAIGPGGLP